MTTLERADPSTFVPVDIQQGNTPGTSLVTSTKSVTFRPVSASVITEVMGYTALGMSELGMNEDNIPYLLWKWHVWLKRMNRWMQENEAYYPSLLLDKKESELTQPLPISLYFHDPVDTAALAPLTPVDLNTMSSALSRGMKNNDNNDANIFGKFVKDVNMLAATIAIKAAGGAEIVNIEIGVKNSILEEKGNKITRPSMYGGDTFPMYMWIGVLLCIFIFFVRVNK